MPPREQRRFFRNPEEWLAIAQRLNQTPCPHRKVVGALIRHGCLYASGPKPKIVRARRVFCSNRNARPGCDRTFSVWCANQIQRLSLTTNALWLVLQLAVTGTILAAGRAVNARFSDRTWHNASGSGSDWHKARSAPR